MPPKSNRKQSRRGAPAGNTNAERHGAYSRRKPRAAATTPTPRGSVSSTSPSGDASPRGADVSSASPPSIDLILLSHCARLTELGQYIDTLNPDAHKRYLAALEVYDSFSYHAGRLLKIKKEIEGGGLGEELRNAMDAALISIGLEIGRKL
ncbi:MAG TPA: hypothetical protein VIK33_01085 [Anaerolineae bacterium]